MDTTEVSGWVEYVQPILLAFGLKVLGAIAVFFAGRWLIARATRLIGAAMARKQVDPTVQRYLGSFLSVGLNVVLVVAILGYFGLETTSFAALVAGVGVAIGAAWSGLLGNFASGVFLLMLRPYKVGDFVSIGGTEGTVVELGMFGTTIDTADNVRTVVGNTKVIGSDIRNYVANPFRRVDLVAQLSGGTDVRKAMALLQAAVSRVPNLVKGPDVGILEFNEFGPKLAVRPYCHNDHYWQVFFDGNQAITDALGSAGFPVATRGLRIYTQEAGTLPAAALAAAATAAPEPIKVTKPLF